MRCKKRSLKTMNDGWNPDGHCFARTRVEEQQAILSRDQGTQQLGYQSVSSKWIRMHQNEPARLNTPATARSAFGTGFTNELDHERWRTQRDVLRDILFSAAECGAWLTLSELAALTRFPEPSIAAQLRALRTPHRGAYILAKRRRSQGPVNSSGLVSAWKYDQASRNAAWEYRVALR